MSLTQIAAPYPIFTDTDGTPLDNGYLFIGEVSKNPETNPIQVYWDAALTQPAPQPIRTMNGYPYRNGTPALLYTDSQFSITIRNKKLDLVLYSPVGFGVNPQAVAGSVVKDDFTGDGVTTSFTISDAPATKLATNAFINGAYQEKDTYSITGNVLTFTEAPPLNASVEIITQQTGVIGATSSNLVSYQPGGAGAVTTNVQTKLREWISVKDFGATGDGVTDDTVAIQAAIDYCTNLSNRKQTLHFPANNAAAGYRITSPLVINGRLNIVGDGQFSTTILADGFSAGEFMLDFNNEAAEVVYFSGMQDITLRSNNSLPTGVRLRNISYMLMKNVQLYGLTTGIYITGTGCFSNFFEQVTGYSISSYTVQWDNFTGGGQYMFTGCTFTGSDGVYLASTAGTDALAFYDCNFEQCVTTDMYIAGSVSGLTISGCRSEGLNGPASFLINPSAGNFVNGVTVTGCSWSTDFGNAYAVDFGGSIKGFSITGNHARYIGFLGFVRLNGAGESGVISGNYCENAPVVANGAPRAGIVIYANSNSSGALPEYWGTAQWGVTEGTWTPTDGSGAGLTFSPAVAKYTKIGRTVTLQLQMTFPSTANTSQLAIAGLPFPIGANSCATAPVDTNKTGAATIAVMRSSSSTTQIFFVDPNSAYYNNAAFSGRLVTLSITYTI